MAPSCERISASYPMSDSMSCIRRAKENGSENRSGKPAEIGPVFPFRNARRVNGSDIRQQIQFINKLFEVAA